MRRFLLSLLVGCGGGEAGVDVDVGLDAGVVADSGGLSPDAASAGDVSIGDSALEDGPMPRDVGTPSPDAAVADAADPWPAPGEPDAPSLSVVIDGQLVAAGEILDFESAPAGLAEVVSLGVTVTNRGDASLEFDGEWLVAEGFSVSDAPAGLEPGESVALEVQFSAVEMAQAGRVEGTLTVPGTDWSITLVADVPRPLRSVVVGDGGLVVVSDDYGASFRVVQAADEGTARHQITWGAGRFFRSWATGGEWQDPGRYAFSDDGLSWTDAQADDAFWASGCAHGLGRFVCAVSDSVAWSETGAGVIFEERQWGPMLHAITFANDRFLAVGREMRVVTSLDGLQWATDRSEADGDWLNAVVDAGDFWVAGGGRDQTVLMVSWDLGGEWTTTVLPESGGVGSVAALDGLVLVSTRSPEDTLYRTRDGREWTRIDTPDWTTYELLGVVNGWFVAAVNPWQQPGQLHRSRDGEDWELVFTAPDARHLRAMAVEGWP